jgi:hypothetical protein
LQDFFTWYPVKRSGRPFHLVCEIINFILL